MTAADIRERLRVALGQRRLTQAELCARLTRRTGAIWHQQHMSKLLGGSNPMTLEQLVLICDVADLSMVDLVRQPGREFVADLTPSELRILELVRDVPEATGHIVQLLSIHRTRELTSKQQHARIREKMRKAMQDED